MYFLKIIHYLLPHKLFFRQINSQFHYQYILMMFLFQIALSLEPNPNFTELSH